MKTLTSAQINKLASRKNVRRIAVENFLSSLGPEFDSFKAIQNLYMDAVSYKWNAATQKAIRDGIDLLTYSKS